MHVQAFLQAPAVLTKLTSEAVCSNELATLERLQHMLPLSGASDMQ